MVSTYPPGAGRANAEAAAWIARLQSPDCGEEAELALADWLDDSEAHRLAFDRAVEVWGMIPAAAMRKPAPAPAAEPERPRRTLRAAPGFYGGLALAASVLLFLAIGGSWWLANLSGRYATAVGEQQMATLEDGTRITLNTDTRLRVRYASDIRSVALDRGEAMFEVAPNPRRPFIVTAGDKAVRAVGTSFIVRKAGDGVVVTLIQGKVAVSDVRTAGPVEAPRPTMLVPGERLTVTGDALSTIDRPSIDAVTAWRRGQAVFTDTPLPAAVAELNRYGGPRVVLGDPALASLRISGVFATNDTVEFAMAIAALHGLRVAQDDGEVRIVR